MTGSLGILAVATLLRIGQMPVSPVADGHITEEEVRASAVAYGAVSDKTGLMSLRYCVFHFGYTDKGVYFAARTSVPPAPQKLADEDCVTLTLQPPGAKKPFVFEAKVAEKGRRIPGVTDYGVEVAETEMFIPYAKLGGKRFKDGEEWGLQMSVAFSSPLEKAFWHWNARNRDELGTFIPDKACPVVSLVHFAPLDSWRSGGSYDICYRAVNSSAAPEKVVSSSFVSCGVGYSKLDNEAEADTAKSRKDCVFTLDLAPGARKEEYHRLSSIWPGTVNTLTVDLRCGEKLVCLRTISWDLEKGLRWKDEIGLPRLYAGVYPSLNNRLRAKYAVNGIRNLVRGGIIVSGADGTRYFERAFRGEPYLKGEELTTELGELPLGKYAIRFAAVDGKGVRYTDERTFEIAKFPWQGLDLGMDRVIIPPYVPIKVEEGKRNEGTGNGTGDRISFLQTGYRCGGILWDEVYAKGENILAAPVDFKLNGSSFTVTDSRIVEKSPDRVVREVTATLTPSQSSQPSQLLLTIRQAYDYDGFCEAHFTFTPQGPVKVESLVLELPLKNSVATLFNQTVRAGDVRSLGSPDFAVPAGEGTLWRSDDRPPKFMLDMYGFGISPYMWLGGPEKGLCFLVDTVKDMSIRRGSCAQKLVRRGDTVAIEFAFVNEETVWDSPKSFKIGFQPSPTKPQEPRGYRSAMNMHGYMRPTNAVGYCTSQVGGFKMWPLVNPMNVYPNNDYSLSDYVLGSKAVDRAEYFRRVRAYAERNRPWFDRCRTRTADGFIAQLEIDWRRMGNTFNVEYMNPWIKSCHWPEWEMYKSEWERYEWTKENEITEYGAKMCRSRIDKLLYDANFSLDRGYNGIYYDCFAEARDYNYTMGPAFRRANGEVQPSLNELFAWRELAKRTAVLCYRRGAMYYGRPLVEIHSTSFQIVPVLSFASVALCLERGGNGGDYQDRFRESYMLTEVTGRQTGTVPRFIVSTRAGDDARKQRELKTLFATMCTYGIFTLSDQGIVYADWFDRAWNAVFDNGWGAPGAEMHWYYDGKPQPVTHDAKDIRVNVAKLRDHALLAFGNLGGAAEVRFDCSGLGFGANVRLTDAETGECLSAPVFPIERRGHRLIRVDRR